MNFETICVSPEDELNFSAAVRALQEGEVVGMPTETVYGLGANALDPEAVKKIYEAKGRPSDNPLIVHVASFEMIDPLVSEITPVAKILMEAFMPGPITIIMKKSHLIPDIVSAGLDTVGIRFPIHPIAQKLIDMCGLPIAAPSANLSGSPSPTKAEHVMKDMHGRIPYVVDGGECQVGLESTVVDATGDWPVVLRPGAITIEDMEQVLEASGMSNPKKVVSSEDSSSGQSQDGSTSAILEGAAAGADPLNTPISQNFSVAEDETPRAPGMKYRHYAPSCPVKIIGDKTGDDFDNYYVYYKQEIMEALLAENTPIGLFVGEEIAENLKILFANKNEEIIYYIYGDSEDVEAASHHLFDGLRTLDEIHVKMIIAPAFPEKGLGIAYMNRLFKAASESDAPVAQKSTRKIMFVCSGNTCRSPMAEAICRSIFRSTGPHHMIDHPETEANLEVTSAGTFAEKGVEFTKYTVDLAGYEYEEDLSGRTSQVVTDELISDQDLVLCMTADHSRYLRFKYPDMGDRIFSLQEIIDHFTIPNLSGEVTDPYGFEYLVYMDTAKQLDTIIREILPEILKSWGME
ncbi:MAG TPA: threonylcarbamoyl-AMP synthase [Clostridiales bacterium]|nr:threonylcarbamoyl-AMP synthase [Clostridiales bacterium]